MSRRSKKKTKLEKALVTLSGTPVSPEPKRRPAGWPDRWMVPGVCIFLAVATWLVFGQTLQFEFVNYDDDLNVYDNSAVKSGLNLSSISWAFKFSRLDYWHPLTMMSHMLDCQLYGLAPAGHHLTNVLLHATAAILLFLVLREMTGALWRSAFVAAVFAIHPLRVESVAWVTERKDVLHGIFFMLTVWAYVFYVRRAWSLMRYLVVVLLFALGLMSKPTLMTLPFVLLLLDYWPLKRFVPLAVSGDASKPAGWRSHRPVAIRLMVEKLPLFVLSTASCMQVAMGNNSAVDISKSLPKTLQISNALVSYVAYIWQMICPVKLAVLYPFPVRGLPLGEVMGAVILLVFISIALFVLRQRHPCYLVGWLWYLGMLVPMIGFVQTGLWAQADRYTYLPQIGLYLLLTWAAADLSAGLRNRRWILGGLSAIIVMALIFCARRQTAYWQNSELLWTHTLACTSDNMVAYNNLGDALLRKGSVDEAITYFQKSLEINPVNAGAHINLGNALLKKGRVDEAIVHYQRALQINPEDAKAHNNLGSALLKKGSVDEAIAHFQKALQINPDYAEAHYDLGNALLQKGSVDEAIAHFQKALQINPDYAEAHINLGNALLKKGKVDEAITHYQTALQIEPDNPGAHINLGNALLRKDSVGEAIAHFQKALQINPDNLEAQNNLAWVLATCPQASLRNGNQAVALAQRAHQLTGDGNPVVLGTLAAAYAEAGRFTEAMETAQRALQVAETQSNTALADALRSQLKLYQAGTAR